MSAIEDEYGEPLHLGLDDYLAWERANEQRHELVNGVVYAITGASYRHNRVATQLTSLLKPASDREPCLVVEVRSPGTQGRDRTVKLAHYCTIPTLQSYLMVSSDPAEPFVVEHRRAGDLWMHQVHGADDVVRLDCPPVELAVRDLHEGLAPVPRP